MRRGDLYTRIQLAHLVVARETTHASNAWRLGDNVRVPTSVDCTGDADLDGADKWTILFPS